MGNAETFVDTIRVVDGLAFRLKALKFIAALPELKADLGSKIAQLSRAFSSLRNMEEL